MELTKKQQYELVKDLACAIVASSDGWMDPQDFTEVMRRANQMATMLKDAVKMV